MLATQDEDGGMHMMPVWFLFRGGELFVGCNSEGRIGSIPARPTILRSHELTPKRELRLGEPREGCRAVASQRDAEAGSSCLRTILGSAIAIQAEASASLARA